jgi:predicted RecA/RadA family phage recombinase
MKNFLQQGNTLTLIAPYALLGGQGFQVGTLFAVASSDAAISAEVEGNTTGVYRLTAATADVVAVGAKVYWDNTAKNVTTVVSTNILIGCAVAAKAGGVVLIDVRLNGTV